MRLFKVFFPTRVVALLFSETAIICACYFAAVYGAAGMPSPSSFDARNLYRIAFVTATIIVGFYFSDLYSQLRVRAKSQLLQQVCFVLGVAFLIQSLLDYLKLPDWALPKWAMIFGSVLVLLIQPAWRILYDRVVLRQFAREAVLFLGASPVARMVAEKVAENPQFGMNVAGFLEDSPASEDLPPGALLGPVSHLQTIVESLRPQRIIVGLTRPSGQPVRELLELGFAGIHIEAAQIAYQDVFHRVSVKDLRRSQIIYMTGLSPRPRGQFLQGIYSFCLALAGFLLASPVMLLAALAIRLTSPGPIICRQIRAGRNGANFTLYRFRTTFPNDGRDTPVGHWLCRLRLHGLPQLINVLRGEMAIVGPRPERPEFIEALGREIPYYRQRLAVKPGLTGWAQINKPPDGIEDTLLKLEYDLYYIKNLNMTLDLYTLFQTAKVMQARLRGN
jgi:lipopolysaccharide/colanic/teichoic acid biosynthesis glycosyltransferase